jgi:hypothetical protein
MANKEWMGLPELDHSGGTVPDLHRIPCSPACPEERPATKR